MPSWLSALERKGPSSCSAQEEGSFRLGRIKHRARGQGQRPGSSPQRHTCWRVWRPVSRRWRLELLQKWRHCKPTGWCHPHLGWTFFSQSAGYISAIHRQTQNWASPFCQASLHTVKLMYHDKWSQILKSKCLLVLG